jgi:hypothetical protein
MNKRAALLLLFVAACQRAPFSDLQLRHGRTRFNVDRLNGQVVEVAKPLVIDATGKEWILDGWAIDAVLSKPATGVLALIDNKETLVGRYGTQRTDVAEATHRPEYERTGFELHLESAGLAPGRHSLSLFVLAADGRGYYRSDSEWTIESR